MTMPIDIRALAAACETTYAIQQLRLAEQLLAISALELLQRHIRAAPVRRVHRTKRTFTELLTELSSRGARQRDERRRYESGDLR